jgi:hypothetical protein
MAIIELAVPLKLLLPDLLKPEGLCSADFNPLTLSHRMLKGHILRPQTQPSNARCVAMSTGQFLLLLLLLSYVSKVVSQYWVMQGSHVDPQLVFPACQRPQGDRADPFKLEGACDISNSPMSDGWLAPNLIINDIALMTVTLQLSSH